MNMDAMNPEFVIIEINLDVNSGKLFLHLMFKLIRIIELPNYLQNKQVLTWIVHVTFVLTKGQPYVTGDRQNHMRSQWGFHTDALKWLTDVLF